MTEIAGYTVPMHAAPGDRIAVMASTDAETFTARLVRIFNGDVNPDGPGARSEPVASALDGVVLSGAVKSVEQGSYALVADGPSLDSGCTLEAWLWPTRPATGLRQVAACVRGSGGGVAVGSDETGRLTVWIFAAQKELVVRTDERLHPRRWVHVAMTVDPTAGSVGLDWQIPSWPRTRGSTSAALPAAALGMAAPSLSFGALAQPGTTARWHFDGKVGEAQLLAESETVAAWAMQEGPEADAVPDPVGGHDAVLVNLPTRSVTGPRWRGRTDVCQKPDEYNAIHFHSDDIDDAGWGEDVAFELPADLASGVYGVELTDADGAIDTVPVFVRPPLETATADVAMLMPTMSYIAYANERMMDHPKLQSPGWLSRPIIPDEGDLMLRRHPEYGGSIYDTHADGSGLSLSSARRPVMNMRAAHRNWQTYAPRALSADLYVLDFFDREGIAVDVITDHLLDAEGAALLDRYSVVITGSHPEYVSEPMIDAFEEYLDGGGRLVYLGGNGFYWVTSVHPTHPWVVEVRRGIGGIRTWESPPGELRHQSTGEPGGLWRYRGRDPNRLLGVGFAGQGHDYPVAPGYAQRPEAADPRAAWIFEGIGDEEIIGEVGLILGGAAADEIDRHDPRWGTPPHALRLATSQGMHSEFMLLVCEDLPVTHPNLGGDVHPAVRADLTFMETGDGGAVFSVGSMGYNGALLHNDRQNAAAQVIRNVVARFRDPTPFPDPPPAEPLTLISQASAVGPIPGELEPLQPQRV